MLDFACLHFIRGCVRLLDITMGSTRGSLHSEVPFGAGRYTSKLAVVWPFLSIIIQIRGYSCLHLYTELYVATRLTQKQFGLGWNWCLTVNLLRAPASLDASCKSFWVWLNSCIFFFVLNCNIVAGSWDITLLPMYNSVPVIHSNLKNDCVLWKTTALFQRSPFWWDESTFYPVWAV